MVDAQHFAERLSREFGQKVDIEVDPPDKRGRITVGVLYDREQFDSEVFVLTPGHDLVQVLNTKHKEPVTLDECVEHVRQLLATVGQPRPKRSLVRRVLTWPTDR